ncbi:MAG: response regulator [Blautia sp.]|nr:response regulator [Blautia sp.]
MKQITLGSCIRTLRIQNQLTQIQLAEQLGVTDKAVSKWERDLSFPDITLFPRLAEVLGVTINDLLSKCREECRPSKVLQIFDVSRDIRTPLHIMLGYVEIAKRNYDDPELLMRYLEGIKVSGEYLMTLLNSVMEENSSSDSPHRREGYPIEPKELEAYLHEKVVARLDKQEDYGFSGKRILIVDDMAINREIAVEVLKHTGAETETAEDGQICFQKIEAMPAGYYDLILMDILMPRMDGLETTRKIRQLSDKEKAAIPIIAMTTKVSEKDRTAALEAGMNAFSEKPIFVDKLFATMGEYLIKNT